MGEGSTWMGNRATPEYTAWRGMKKRCCNPRSGINARTVNSRIGYLGWTVAKALTTQGRQRFDVKRDGITIVDLGITME